jgi:hypothetical protein
MNLDFTDQIEPFGTLFGVQNELLYLSLRNHQLEN